MTTSKTHFHGNINGGWRSLWCTGRSVQYAFTKQIPDEVTCGACRRKMLAQAKAA